MSGDGDRPRAAGVEPGAAAILTRSRDLITRGWTRGAEARDSAGAEVDPWSADACHWSLLGALVAAADLAADPDAASLRRLRQALGALAEVIEEPLLATWNDDPCRTQAEVIETLDAAIRICARGVM